MEAVRQHTGWGKADCLFSPIGDGIGYGCFGFDGRGLWQATKIAVLTGRAAVRTFVVFVHFVVQIPATGSAARPRREEDLGSPRSSRSARRGKGVEERKLRRAVLAAPNNRPHVVVKILTATY